MYVMKELTKKRSDFSLSGIQGPATSIVSYRWPCISETIQNPSAGRTVKKICYTIGGLNHKTRFGPHLPAGAVGEVIFLGI